MQKIAILYDASQAVLSTFELDEVLNRILSILRDYFQFQNSTIFLLDPATNELYVRAHFGRAAGSEASRIPVAKGLIGTAAQIKRPIYAPDVSKDPRYVKAMESTRSEVAIPLMVRDDVVGVLDCQSDQLDFFSQETVDLLTLFSTQASIALENARLYSLERRRSTQLEAINTIARETTGMLDLGQLLDKVCSMILSSFPVDEVAVLLREEEGDLVIQAQQGRLTPRMRVGGRLPSGAGLCGRALASGRPVVENDVRKVEGYVTGYDETRSELCLPLISFGQTLGVLALENATEDAFQPADVQALESMADICAGAIQNARFFDRVKQMAYLDGLTSIYNRRYFEMRVVEEMERASRYTGQMAVIMVDIDHFKKLNDEFGHLLGDEVLRQMSAIFTQQLRKADVVCRYGGEEFAILVPETTGENAMGVAEKLRRVVESWPFPGVPRPVTISAGVADYPENGTTRDELMRAADEALYAAKQAGRNRVMAAVGVRKG
jgi:diguanylate cyclase (GGDEF)-like protein